MTAPEAPPTPTAPPKPKRRWLRRTFIGLAAGLLTLVAAIYFVYILPFWGIPFNQSRHGRVPLTPPWALECWLWEDDVNTEAYEQELLDGYAARDIPVRTLLIDSPWSERYNDFKVDETTYPNPEAFIRGLKGRGYRVVLWMTCMVNSRSKDTKVKDSREFFERAKTKGYLAGDGYEWHWWKGSGGFIDYSNPDAMLWWHGLQQQVLNWGVDGWKLDGADTFFSSRIGKLPVPFSRVHSGWRTTRWYMDHFARDELAYGQKVNLDFAILVRALDQPWSHPEGFAPLDAATVTWVGDNSHTWKKQGRGIENAIADILGSAKLGYCVIGSDVAGYHGRSNPDDIGAATAALVAGWKPRTDAGIPFAGTNQVKGAETRVGQAPSPPPPLATNQFKGDEIAPNIYLRWAEFSCFCGLFLNGGHGERRLWHRTPAELEIVRKFSWLHTELVPYMYSHVVECHLGGRPLMRPLAGTEYDYRFGDDFLVAPIHEDSPDRTITLPAGRWRYLFDDRVALPGPEIVDRAFPLDEFPVYVREGAVVPLRISRPYTGFGDTNSADFTTWLIYPAGTNRFTLWHPERHPNPDRTTVTVEAGESLRITFVGTHEPHLLRIHATEPPQRVALDGQELAAGTAWTYDAARRKLIITTREYGQGRYEVVFPKAAAQAK